MRSARGVDRGTKRSYSHPTPPRTRRQCGHIEELPSGSYRTVVFAGSDPLTRRPRYARETVKTYDEAKKAAVKLQRQVDEDQHPKSSITVRQAIEPWLEVAAWGAPPAGATTT